MQIQRLSHFGLCVSDLQRSLAFYRDVFGFRELSRLALDGAAAEKLLGLPGGKLQAVYLERDGTRIELLFYPDTTPAGREVPRPMNRVGLSHLSFRVCDLDATVAAVQAAGGDCMYATRVDNETWGTHAVFVLDPDGQRIELLQAPGDPDALPGA